MGGGGSVGAMSNGVTGGGGGTSIPNINAEPTLPPPKREGANVQKMPKQKLTHGKLLNLVAQTQKYDMDSENTGTHREGEGTGHTQATGTVVTQKNLDESDLQTAAAKSDIGDLGEEDRSQGNKVDTGTHEPTQANAKTENGVLEGEGETHESGVDAGASMQPGEGKDTMQGELPSNNESLFAKVALTPIRAIRGMWESPLQRKNDKLEEGVNAKGSGNGMEGRKAIQ